MNKPLFLSLLLCLCSLMTLAQNNDSIAVDSAKVVKPEISNPHYIDEVVWVVGDEAILRSDIEIARMQAEQEGIKWDGDPDCRIPESIAVQKLFINQAALDSIVVTESEISQAIDQQINGWIQMIERSWKNIVSRVLRR